MKMTLGINNCFAVKRWPRADEWAQIVRDELQLDTVQHSLDLSNIDSELETEAKEVRTVCDRHLLTIHSVFTGLIAYSTSLMLAPTQSERVRAMHYWSQAIRFASLVHARCVGGHVGSLSRHDADDPSRRDALWEMLRTHLIQLSQLAREYELEALLVENMGCDREPCRMSELGTLLRPADPTRAAIALCLDVGHQCVPGVTGDDANPYAWLRIMGRDAPVIHLQQSDAEADHHWPFTADYNARGRIRAADVLEALAASTATETTLILEIIPPFEADDRQVLEELRESVSYWQHAIGSFQSAGASDP